MERQSRAAAVQRLVWRGIHDAAHLDHIEALTDLTESAPSPVEFGHGLCVAEAYAMAVEITATVACLLDGKITVARTLRSGLIERIGRLFGADDEFAVLPTLAEAYVLEPVRLLSGAATGPLLPAGLADPLVRRWMRLCEVFPAAARLTEAARDLG